MESRDLGKAFGAAELAAGIERSEVGGDGGVGASETVEDADLVGGVGMVGEDVEVVWECCDVRDNGRGSSGVGFLDRCLWAAASAFRS